MLNIIWGSNKEKPEAAMALASLLSADAFHADGYLYIGYPIMGSPLGPVKFDALLLSKQYGLIAFDLVEGLELDGFEQRLDDIASMLEVKLKPYPALKVGRQLKFEIQTFTFAPAKKSIPKSVEPHILTNRDNLLASVESCTGLPEELFGHLLAAVQVVTSIRSGRLKREPKNAASRGARLKRVEESIANLDQHQSRAVIETVEGVQRIRGLAGSGKTIVLALKVAYLHSQNPDWKIAVTFNTRSLKEQFKRLINSFTIEQTSSEPDWDRIDIINAWGGPGDKEQDGIYHKFCRAHGIEFLDFGTAKARYTSNGAFGGAVQEALKYAGPINPLYDLILIDEAQDFPSEFLRLCHRFITEPKRLVYAYDELQSLTGNAVLPPEQLFGSDANGKPIVEFDYSKSAIPRQDIILEKCYRNPRPVLAAAHALGFGIYRDGGLVQFFDQDKLWTDVGYTVEEGELEPGQDVTLARTAETSPLFLEDHSPIDDLLKFVTFEDKETQAQWLFESIRNDIESEELRPEDIVVINPDPIKTQEAVGKVRQLLFSAGINSEIAGVSTSRDVFSKDGAVTFTGIFRAKGNEAGMIYVLNAQDCYSAFTKSQLALIRNRLFTALTRSKGWVRVLGIGPKMDSLTEECSRLKNQDYKLKFKYPTEEEKKLLRLINIEPTAKQNARERRLQLQRDELLQAIRAGDIDVNQLLSDFQMAGKGVTKK
ncbi:DEAD/DEAH box helicase [Delftia acidovorans]|uniref:DNA 3'-5' helicase II n=1 Tax=Delftia acidovorans TaxID=80866 RepID=A0AAJ2VEN8_DELAC|nr:ATP-binding domain-containing protein [Delftia acidovorans]MDX4956082.1 ATP-binding domain-containing protein [Delftia acidovorans]